MSDLTTAPAFEKFDGDFDGKTFGFRFTNADQESLTLSMTPEQVAQMVAYVFRLPYDWQQKHRPKGQTPKDIPADAIVPVHGLGLAQGVDEKHATVVVGSDLLTVGFHTEISKIAKVCEALHQAARVPLYDSRKPQKH